MHFEASQKRILHLEQRNAWLESENANLKDALAPSGLAFPREWGLTASEDAFLKCLYSAPKGGRSQDALHVASNRTGAETDLKIVQIWAMKVRQKVTPLGIQIDTLWGWGYELTPDSVAIIKQAVAQ